MKFRVPGLALILSIAAIGANLDFATIPLPPFPPNQWELVTGDAQPVQDAQQRIAALGLLEKAHRLSNVRAQPYELRTSFISSGAAGSDGNWVLEDIAPKGGGYRWTAQGPSYSAINLYPESVTSGLYGNQPSGILPRRLIQARAAIFFAYPIVGPLASVRTAAGVLNGAQQNCVLIVIGAGKRTFTGGRNWAESEYCIDAQTGLLTQYSPAPGLFVRYDYSSGIQFHDKRIPTAFSISENGQVVLEAQTVSVTDPPARTDAMFDTAGLTALGAGRAMNPGMNITFPTAVPGQGFPRDNASAAIQMVTLHGNLSGDGKLSEVEILASTDPGLNQAAIAQASSLAQMRAQNQPGATAQSSELLLSLEFVTSVH